MANVSNIVARYKAKKARGLVVLAKIGSAYAASFKRWDTEDGTQTVDVTAIDMADLTTLKTDLQSQIADINLLIADLQALA